MLDREPWLSKGLGGIALFGATVRAAALDAPQDLVDGLSQRSTQIIPPELMAAVGMLSTYQQHLRGKEVIFSIDS